MEYRGRTLEEALHKSLHEEHEVRRLRHGQKKLSRKGRFDVWAPPLIWGPWVNIWAQFGVIGPDSENHQSILNVTFSSLGGDSSFDVEIKGGDDLIRTTGPGSELVTITGNVATSVSIRCRSHSVGLHVLVIV